MKKKKRINKRLIKENIELGALTLPVIILLAVFSYWPMFGLVLAFKDYRVPDGIWGSAWIKPLFKNFEFFFKSQDAVRVIRNTIVLNFAFIITGIVCSVIVALLLYELKKSWHIKMYQTIFILPNFLSWVAVSYVVYGFLDSEKGIINYIIRLFGGENIQWYQEPAYWPVILVLVRIWHGVGLGCIIYYAALMGIDNELFEAAEIDGANKLQKIRYISIPSLIPIITIKFIMDVGGIFRADFGMFYNVPRNVGTLYPATDVMDTYVFRALMELGNIGMSSAASFIQSVVCCLTLLITNTIIRKVSPENALF